ncbi:MAG: hypothetical protein PUJ55_07570 [Clostridiales bacterium]|nr:hypothetical protein [Roseburia sp.]MDD7636779.1 hypothetical protein [Clostridiales bacterium]MDY4113074.1 hypothetical protein [Roseburia sp.]
MIEKKKTLGIGTLAIAAVAALVFVLVPLWGTQTQAVLGENQNYVYVYVSEIQGNEITYMKLEESVVTAYLEQREAAEETVAEVEEGEAAEDESFDRALENAEERQADGEMPGRPSGEASSGEVPDREAPGGGMSSQEASSGEVSTEEGMSSMDAGPDAGLGRMNTKTTTLIPVGVIVHTQSDAETTFRRLASGDIIKMLVETTEDGEEIITEIWML